MNLIYSRITVFKSVAGFTSPNLLEAPMGLLSKSKFRSLELVAGDLLVVNTADGKLELVRAKDSSRVDLNGLIEQAGATSIGTEIMKSFNPLTFGQMASVVAITHGLNANEVRSLGSILSCELTDPD